MRNDMQQAHLVHHREQPILFSCEGEHLLGIFTSPAEGSNQHGDIGVVVVVGGPQYRVGSHRQFLHLARFLADAGVPVLRFDVRGMGDSTGALHTFENITPDISAAIIALRAHAPQVRRVALWGLCDGASAALLYREALPDPSLCGMCLLNPWVRSETSLARAHVKHYYTDRLRQKAFWLKLLRGQVAASALAGLWRNIRLMRGGAPAASDAPFQLRMANAWKAFEGDILLVLSEEDYTAREFLEYAESDRAWRGMLDSAKAARHDLKRADHTFSSAVLRAQVAQVTRDWVCRL